jgi:hypothetical protein
MKRDAVLQRRLHHEVERVVFETTGVTERVDGRRQLPRRVVAVIDPLLELLRRERRARRQARFLFDNAARTQWLELTERYRRWLAAR